MKISIPSIDTVRGWINGLRRSFKILRTILLPPAIEVKLVGEVQGCWQLEVRNAGHGVAIPKVFLEDVTDGNGKSTGKVTSPVEIFRLHSTEPLRLFGHARGVYGIFGPRSKPHELPIIRFMFQHER